MYIYIYIYLCVRISIEYTLITIICIYVCVCECRPICVRVLGNIHIDMYICMSVRDAFSVVRLLLYIWWIWCGGHGACWCFLLMRPMWCGIFWLEWEMRGVCLGLCDVGCVIVVQAFDMGCGFLPSRRWRRVGLLISGNFL